MVEEMSYQIRAKFAEGAKSLSRKRDYKTPMEWETKGLTNFKRRVLGICREETTKSLDELAEILIELRVVDSADSGKQLIQEICGTKVDYKGGHLEFTRACNRKGQKACKINIYGYVYDIC